MVVAIATSAPSVLRLMSPGFWNMFIATCKSLYFYSLTQGDSEVVLRQNNKAALAARGHKAANSGGKCLQSTCQLGFSAMHALLIKTLANYAGTSAFAFERDLHAVFTRFEPLRLRHGGWSCCHLRRVPSTGPSCFVKFQVA